MDNETTLCEKEAIRLGFERRIDHFLLLLLGKLGQFVHVLPLVCGFRNAEGEVEFELRQDLSAEEMLFDQSQLLQWLVSIHIRKLQIQLQVAQHEEGAWKLVL